MEFVIRPLSGVDDLSFGMRRHEVKRLVRGDLEPVGRAGTGGTPSDFARALGIFYYYDADERLEAVEFSKPATPIVADAALLGLGFSEAAHKLCSLDPDVKVEIDRAIAYGLGVSVWAPLAKDDPSAPIESVLAFRPGCYD